MTGQISFSCCSIDVCHVVIMHHHCAGIGSSGSSSGSHSGKSIGSGLGSSGSGRCSFFVVALWKADGRGYVIVAAAVASSRSRCIALAFLA